jgi:hypothetical protein
MNLAEKEDERRVGVPFTSEEETSHTGQTQGRTRMKGAKRDCSDVRERNALTLNYVAQKPEQVITARGWRPQPVLPMLQALSRCWAACHLIGRPPSSKLRTGRPGEMDSQCNTSEAPAPGASSSFVHACLCGCAV